MTKVSPRWARIATQGIYGYSCAIPDGKSFAGTRSVELVRAENRKWDVFAMDQYRVCVHHPYSGKYWEARNFADGYAEALLNN